MEKEILGVIGGTGLDSFDGFASDWHTAETPYGNVEYKRGELEGREIVFVPRHQRGHLIPPHMVNYRGIMAALKSSGCESVVSFSSVGAFSANVNIGEVVIPSGSYSYNVNRQSTFFDVPGAVVHVGMKPAVCEKLSYAVKESSEKAKNATHGGGLYLCIQGPQYLEEKESKILAKMVGEERRDDGWMEPQVIGMCINPEIKLAREAGMCYAMVALVTDYNNHLQGHPAVSTEEVKRNAEKNIERAQGILKELAARYDNPGCACHKSLEDAVMTYKPEMLTEHPFVDGLLRKASGKKGG